MSYYPTAMMDKRRKNQRKPSDTDKGCKAIGRHVHQLREYWGLPDGSVVKTLLSMQETQETRVWSLSREDPLEKRMSSPWTEEPGGLRPRGCKQSDVTERLSTRRRRTWSLLLCKTGCYRLIKMDMLRPWWPTIPPVGTHLATPAPMAHSGQESWQRATSVLATCWEQHKCPSTGACHIFCMAWKGVKCCRLQE